MLVRNDERCVISFFVLLLCWCSLAWSQNLTWSVDLVPFPPFPLSCCCCCCCYCCVAGQPNRLVERDAYTNELFPYKKCMACPSKSVVLAPLQNPYLCRPCPHRNMTYDIETFACKCEPSSIFETVGLSFYGPQSCIYKNELYQGSQNAGTCVVLTTEDDRGRQRERTGGKEGEIFFCVTLFSFEKNCIWLFIIFFFYLFSIFFQFFLWLISFWMIYICCCRGKFIKILDGTRCGWLF